MKQNNDLSRRALLGSLGTVGTAGAVFGTGTSSLFTDREVFGRSVVEAGLLDLLVSWDGGTSEDGDASLTIDLTDGSGSAVVSVAHAVEESNPVRVWLRTTCPTGPADTVYVTASYVCSDEVIASGTLLNVANKLRNGIRLDPDCDTTAGCLPSGGELDIEFDWEFVETDDYNGNNPENVELQLQFRGKQCRNNTPSNPFPWVEPCVTYYGTSFIQIYDEIDGSCELVGKLELEPSGNYDQDGIGDSYIEPGTYDLYEDDAGDDTGYDVVVTDTVQKDDGDETIAVEFELVDPDGSDPELCRVDVKGGPGPPGGDSELTYDTGFDGNATGRLLYAPTKEGSG
jgi:predicted ribosomally synthesized peptide with SipW-like signal peptide